MFYVSKSQKDFSCKMLNGLFFHGSFKYFVLIFGCENWSVLGILHQNTNCSAPIFTYEKGDGNVYIELENGKQFSHMYSGLTS